MNIGNISSKCKHPKGENIVATLKVHSFGEAFSFVIRKNPASGMIAKSIRKGTAFGWFSDPNTYCVAFFDGMDEISFAKKRNQDFAFLDRTRYNAPLFLPTALREFFQTALRKRNEEQDVPGSFHAIEVSSIEIERMEIFEKLVPLFDGFRIETAPLLHERGTAEQEKRYSSFSLKISTETRTLHELLNLGYLLGYLIATISHVEFQVEQGILLRLIDACNLLDVPYYVKHLIKTGCIHTMEDFKKAEAVLKESKTETLKFAPGTNANERFLWVRSQIPRDTDILDFGCGEGRFFPLAKRIPDSTYYAIDRDAGVRDEARKSAERRELENVIVLESLEAFLELETGREFVAVLSEVFEHNEPAYMREVLRGFFQNPDCAKILLTTPNRDFNPFYHLAEGEKRHPDHIVEMSKAEAEAYFTDVARDTNFACKMTGLGDEVNGIPTILAFAFTRKGRETE